MRFITTRVNGYLDYIVGGFLIVSPWILAFARGDAAMWVPMIIGLAVISYSLFTDYELGVWHIMPMNVHLWLDGIGGGMLAVSPWILSFADYVWGPHVVFGIFAIIVALSTETVPDAQY